MKAQLLAKSFKQLLFGNFYPRRCYHAALGRDIFIIGLVAALLGVTGVAGTATYIAYVLFVIFVIVAIVSLVMGKRPPA